MSPNEIKRIVNCVVDYSWPWQVGYTSLYHTEIDWQPPINGDIYTLLADLSVEMPIRLDPGHIWDWPIETREGMPCWARYKIGMLSGNGDSWFPWKLTNTDFVGVKDPEVSHMVTPHPLNPTMEPPADWSPENKRILK